MDELQWWLISNESVEKIQAALQSAIKHIDDECGSSGCLCDLRKLHCSQSYSDALHDLDSDLHITEAIPDDWKVIDYEDDMEKWYLVETADGAEIGFGSPNSVRGLTMTGGKKVHQIACAQYIIGLHEKAEDEKE